MSSCHHLWRTPGIAKEFRTAVSLHGHTQHSEESLDFIPRYSRRVPLLSQLVAQQERRYLKLYGRPLDFRRAWWTPPLSPREAFHLEQNQIEQELGLKALISLTDHDDIEAPVHLQVLSESRDIPISVEWTVPWGPTFFHLGVHNLPTRTAHAVMDELSAFTDAPRPERLAELLEALHSDGSTLIVLNHPLWDEPGIGVAEHAEALNGFMRAHRRWLHAAELNGLRHWGENAAVEEFALLWGLPVISGGDRHGVEPNAVVNLTNAATFSEFADEVRAGRSQVLYMNQYREPIRLRIMQSLLAVVSDYPELADGRRKWTDRVFFRSDDGRVKPLSSLWEDEGPAIVKLFMTGVRLLQSKQVRDALRFALTERREEGAT